MHQHWDMKKGRVNARPPVKNFFRKLKSKGTLSATSQTLISHGEVIGVNKNVPLLWRFSSINFIAYLLFVNGTVSGLRLEIR